MVESMEGIVVVECMCANRASGMRMTMCCRRLPWEVSDDCGQFCLLILSSDLISTSIESGLRASIPFR